MSVKRNSGSIKKVAKKSVKKTVKAVKAVKKEVKKVVKKVVKKATKPASPKSVKKTKTTVKKSKTSSARKPVSQPAIELINKGASLLKKAVLKSEEGAVEGRRVVKTKGLKLVDKTSETLQSIINSGAETVSEGLKKL